MSGWRQGVTVALLLGAMGIVGCTNQPDAPVTTGHPTSLQASPEIGRYQLVQGRVTVTQYGDSDRIRIMQGGLSPTDALFRIDTVTGKTWVYKVDVFPNKNGSNIRDAGWEEVTDLHL